MSSSAILSGSIGALVRPPFIAPPLSATPSCAIPPSLLHSITSSSFASHGSCSLKRLADCLGLELVDHSSRRRVISAIPVPHLDNPHVPVDGVISVAKRTGTCHGCGTESRTPQVRVAHIRRDGAAQFLAFVVVREREEQQLAHVGPALLVHVIDLGGVIDLCRAINSRAGRLLLRSGSRLLWLNGRRRLLRRARRLVLALVRRTLIILLVILSGSIILVRFPDTSYHSLLIDTDFSVNRLILLILLLGRFPLLTVILDVTPTLIPASGSPSGARFRPAR